MRDKAERIREEVKRILESGEGEIAIGYESGTVPPAARPVVKLFTPTDGGA